MPVFYYATFDPITDFKFSYLFKSWALNMSLPRGELCSNFASEPASFLTAFKLELLNMIALPPAPAPSIYKRLNQSFEINPTFEISYRG